MQCLWNDLSNGISQRNGMAKQNQTHHRTPNQSIKTKQMRKYASIALKSLGPQRILLCHCAQPQSYRWHNFDKPLSHLGFRRQSTMSFQIHLQPDRNNEKALAVARGFLILQSSRVAVKQSANGSSHSTQIRYPCEYVQCCRRRMLQTINQDDLHLHLYKINLARVLPEVLMSVCHGLTWLLGMYIYITST